MQLVLHLVGSKTPPCLTPQYTIAVDVNFIEGEPVLHVVDKCTYWSEASVLRRRKIKDQIDAPNKIKVYVIAISQLYTQMVSTIAKSLKTTGRALERN